MSRKLQNDKIEASIKVNTSEAQKNIYELNKATRALRDQNKEYRKEIAELAKQEGDHSAEIKRVEEQIRRNTVAMDDNRRQIERWEKGLDASGMTISQLNKALRSAKTELNNTSKAADPQRYAELQNRVRTLGTALQQARNDADGAGKSFGALSKVGDMLKGAFMGIGVAITTSVIGAFRSLKDVVMDFSAANSKLAAILGTSKDGIKQLTDQAKELGRTTTATASQVSSLQTELAKLGFTQEQIVAMTPGVLRFAKAVDTDLGSAAAFAGAALRIFGKDASETEDVLATLAIATTKSSLDFAKLQASMSTIGPVAAAYGLSLEDTTALLGALANAGFDASSAATATRNILLNLCDANGELAKALGGSVTDLDSMVAGLKKLNAEGVDLARVLELTDKRSVSAFNTLLAGADSLTELRDGITGANEDFKQMAATMADNGRAAEAGFSSAIEGLLLQFGGLDNIIAKVYKGLTTLVQWVGKAVSAMQPMATTIWNCAKYLGHMVGELLDLIKSVVQAVASFAPFKWILTVVKTLLTGVVAAWVAYKVALAAAWVQAKAMAVLMTLKTTLMGAYSLATKGAALATRGFAAAIKSVGLLRLISAVAGVIAMIVELISSLTGANKALEETEENLTIAEKSQKRMKEGTAAMAAQFDAERRKLMDLRRAAADETATKESRLKAIKELNRIVPGYCASLDAETGKYRENKKALDDYLKSLEKKIKMEKYQEMLSEAVGDQTDLKNQYYDEFFVNREKLYRESIAAYKAYDQAMTRARRKGDADEYKRLLDLRSFHGDRAKMMLGGASSVNEMRNMDFGDWWEYNEKYQARGGLMVNNIKASRDAIDEIYDRAKRIDGIDMAEILSADEETTDKIVGSAGAIDKETKALRDLEKQIDEMLAPEKEQNRQNLAEIAAKKGDVSATELNIEKLQEDVRHAKAVYDALDRMREGSAKGNAEMIAKITENQNEAASAELQAEQNLNDALLALAKERYDNALAVDKAGLETQTNVIKKAVTDREISQEQADLYLLAEQRKSYNTQLSELTKFSNEAKRLYIEGHLGEADYDKIETENLGRERKLQSQILTSTAKWVKLMRDLSTNAESRQGIAADYAERRTLLERYYDKAIELAKANGDDTADLEAEKLRRMKSMQYDYHRRLFELQKLTGVSWGEEYQDELAKLEQMHANGLLLEKDYQAARLQMQIDNAQKYFNYYSELGTSAFTDLQNAEIATSDAKYDVLIRQAENAGEDTTALEEEKEAKKLDIQKKYADVAFGIKVSQIIADTAVSIMKAFADLGPIAGAVAAAMLTATGAAQVMSAKAERDKIKALQPKHTATTSSTTTETTTSVERVLTGYADGGYTGNGGKWEVAGLVHKGEYVVPQAIMRNPAVVDAVGIVEAIRTSRTGAVRGYADGGYTATPAGKSGAAPSGGGGSSLLGEMAVALTDLRQELAALRRNGINASVQYRDFEVAAKATEKSRSRFTRS